MACAWSFDSKSLVTSSADYSVKLCRYFPSYSGFPGLIYEYQGDVEAQKNVTTWSLGTSIGNQQVGNVWAEENEIVSLSVDGNLNVFDPRAGDKPIRVLVVHFSKK